MFASFLSCTQMVRPRCLKATVHFNVDFAKRNIVNSKTDKGVLMERWRQHKCVEKISFFFFNFKRLREKEYFLISLLKICKNR